MNKEFHVSESDKYGVVLRINSTELADEFDDYLTEKCYVFLSQKFMEEYVEFYFGQASSIDNVKKLIERFGCESK